MTETLFDSELHVLPEAPPRKADELDVKRVFPTRHRRNVGPFVFFDHFGPATTTGQGVNVRPHPHIGLSTVTYLLEGAILHQDSLGYRQVIRPGAINWMTAGRGIVHSERTPPELRSEPTRMHGVQIWVALPLAEEECEPAFAHYPEESLPTWDEDGVRFRVLAGTFHGRTSPVVTAIDLFYVELRVEPGSTVTLGASDQERGLYGIDGILAVNGTELDPGHLALLPQGQPIELQASAGGTWLFFGGPPLDAPRYLDWNFVASSREKLEWAKAEWRARRFPLVPGDADEFIPLPE